MTSRTRGWSAKSQTSSGTAAALPRSRAPRAGFRGLSSVRRSRRTRGRPPVVKGLWTAFYHEEYDELIAENRGSCSV